MRARWLRHSIDSRREPLTTNDATSTTYGPGLHEVTDADPESAALDLAGLLDGELLVDPGDLEQALRAREQDRRAIEPATLKQLRSLATELEKAERIRARTEAKVIGVLGDQLSTGTGLAVHPAAIREAGEALVAARAAMEEVERAEQAAQQAAAAVTAPEAVTREDRPVFDYDPGPARRRGTAAVIAALVIAAVVIAGGLVPFYVALILPLIAVAWTLAQVRGAHHEATGSHEAASLLSDMGAATDELFGRRQAAPLGRSRALEVQRDAAIERLRVAEHQWSDLAGPGADPDDVEAVLRRRDPQLHRAEVWAAESAAVRTAAAVHRKARARWRVAWAAIDQEPPASADAGGVIDALAAEGDVPTDRRPLIITGAAAAACSEGRAAERLRWLTRTVAVVMVGPDAQEPGA
jgi:hypothetical protein